MADDSDYKSEIRDLIDNVRDDYQLQPIVFVGSGLSKRWLDTPSWKSLLEWAAAECKEVEKPLQFYVQQEGGDLARVASRLKDCYQKWAWGDGKNNFPAQLFQGSFPADIYLKNHISEYIKSFGSKPDARYNEEVTSFKDIRPHCLITTNYDELLENIFDDYTTVLDRGLITAPFASIGEIFKIHGTVDKPSSLVLTSEDYATFAARRKYLTAKLLTFFAEHPILFVGYSVNDENIKNVLSDLDEAMEIPGDLLSNVFVLSRKERENPAREKVVQVSTDKGVRVNSIEADDFSWVFDAFSHKAPLTNVNPKALRAILARSYNLVRSDIPKQNMEVDFELISGLTSSSDEFAKLFGISSLQPATEFSSQYRYSLSELGRALGYKSWHGADRLFKKIESEKNVNLKHFDNKYHCSIRLGPRSIAQKYSDAALALLQKVKNGDDYEVET